MSKSIVFKIAVVILVLLAAICIKILWFSKSSPADQLYKHALAQAEVEEPTPNNLMQAVEDCQQIIEEYPETPEAEKDVFLDFSTFFYVLLYFS